MKLGYKKLDPRAYAPERGSLDASGADLRALSNVVIPAGQTVLVKTGIAFDIPTGYEVQVRARSGLSLKTGLRVANGIGTVDKDYQGDCGVIIHNTSQDDYIIAAGDRIAQAVLCPVIIPDLVEIEGFQEVTSRGTSGFGSTGKN